MELHHPPKSQYWIGYFGETPNWNRATLLGSEKGRPSRIIKQDASLDQYASALMTSPPAMVLIEIQVMAAIVFLTNRTEPSPKPVMTPPG